jgi:hypothetical protein
MKTYLPFVFVSLFLLLGSCGPNIYFQLREKEEHNPILSEEPADTIVRPRRPVPPSCDCFCHRGHPPRTPSPNFTNGKIKGYYFDPNSLTWNAFGTLPPARIVPSPFTQQETCLMCDCRFKPSGFSPRRTSDAGTHHNRLYDKASAH